MDRVNPLHIGILLSIILIFVSVKLDSSKESLRLAKENLKETKVLAVELRDFKEIYADNTIILRAINRILSLNALKSANITQKRTNSGITLSSASMGKSALNSLMGKLINSSYNIDKFTIRKLNNENVSLEVEIKW